MAYTRSEITLETPALMKWIFNNELWSMYDGIARRERPPFYADYAEVE